jgi:hypothetical protein
VYFFKMKNPKNLVWLAIAVFFGLNIMFQIIFITNNKIDINIQKQTNQEENIVGKETNGKYPKLAELSENFPKIQIIMPTMYRRTTGYNYILKTFNSFKSSLSSLNVEFGINAFERKSIFNNELPLKDPNFKLTKFQQSEKLRSQLKDPETELKKVQKKYREVNIEKIHKWNNQALDWLEMIRIWKSTNCSNSPIFLYMEDDFEVCQGATTHLLSNNTIY